MRIGLLSLALGYAAPAVAGDVCAVPYDYLTLQNAVEACAFGTVEVDARAYFPIVDFPGVVIRSDVSIVGVEGRADLPHLDVAAATVSVDNARFGSIPDPLPEDYLLEMDAAITVIGGSLTLTNSELSATEKTGIAAVGAEVVLEEVDATGFAEPVVVVVAGDSGERASLTVQGGAYTYNLQGVLRVQNADTTLSDANFTGNSAPVGAVLLIEGNRRHLTLSNTTVADSYTTGDESYGYGGAILAIETDVVVTGGEFRGGQSPFLTGAGLTVYGWGGTTSDLPTLVATDVRWSDNTSGSGGGALTAVGCDVTVGTSGDAASTVFERNTSTGEYGAGGAVSLTYGVARFEGAEFVGNSAYAGGAVAVADGAVTFDGVVMDGTGADVANGGFVYAWNGHVDFVGSRLRASSVSEAAGAIYALGESAVSIEGGEISQVYAASGGGVAALQNGSFAMRGALSEGTGGAYAGFLYARDVGVTIEDSVFLRSEAANGGGALHLEDPRSVLVARSTFCDGLAGDGGAVEMFGRPTRGTARVANSIFAYNRGAAALKLTYGSLGGQGEVQLYNNDFVHNATAVDVRLWEEGADLRNTLFVGSALAIDAQSYAVGGYNLYDGVGAQVQGAGFADKDAVIGEALFVGGAPTGCDADLRPTADSPVVDAGDPTMPTDLGDAVDIGAFEYVPDTDVPDTDAPDTDVDGDPDDRPPAWVSGGGGCSTAGGPGAAWGLPALALLALRGRRRAVRPARFG